MRITRSKGILLVALVSALALMIGQGALATHGNPPVAPHETVPTPVPVGVPVRATCTVDGRVNINPGVSPTPGHNHYVFTATTIDCTDSDPQDNSTDRWNGLYDVDANGGTDGPDHVNSGEPPESDPDGGSDHGEDCELGWSNSSGYSGGDSLTVPGNVHKGDIGATHVPDGQSSPLGSPNWVKFVRTGTVVQAWGELTFGANSHHGAGAVRKFYATLQFTPDQLPPPPQNCAVTPVTGARLTGTATFWG